MEVRGQLPGRGRLEEQPDGDRHGERGVQLACEVGEVEGVQEVHVHKPDIGTARGRRLGAAVLQHQAAQGGQDKSLVVLVVRGARRRGQPGGRSRSRPVAGGRTLAGPRAELARVVLYEHAVPAVAHVLRPEAVHEADYPSSVAGVEADDGIYAGACDVLVYVVLHRPGERVEVLAARHPDDAVHVRAEAGQVKREGEQVRRDAHVLDGRVGADRDELHDAAARAVPVGDLHELLLVHHIGAVHQLRVEHGHNQLVHLDGQARGRRRLQAPPQDLRRGAEAAPRQLLQAREPR
mmetsp:Transcript_35850/g.99363  ORF Transcript_35850/g.99363 Transcript_35850/m.99363 type:complete len:293 (+) Transcript_35850:1391-2269(+)